MTRNRTARLGTVLAAITVALLGQVAAAHLKAHSDGDDVKHALDVRGADTERVTMGEYQGLKYTVRMHDAFSESDLNQGGVRINIDSRGDRRMDFYLLAHLYEGSYPICELYDRNGFMENAATIKVGDRYVSCALVRNAVRPTKHISWKVRATVGEGVDLAPNSGRYKH